MKEIKNGIVFSEDIKRILDGVNAFDYDYGVSVNQKVIDEVRSYFKKQTNKIFDGKVTIVSEEEMMMVNGLIGGEYPHCYIR